jgi:DNA polymerase-1
LSYDEMREFAAADKFTLNLLAAENPKIRPLLDYRKAHKAYSTYIRPMRNIFTAGIDKKDREKEQYMMRDKCVHPNFNQCGTRGGRLSSSNPNAQNLPRDSSVKRVYTSRFGEAGCIYQGDLSQIELRLLAAGCGDPNMVDAYHKGIDIHSLTTSLIFKIPYEHFSKDYMSWLQKNGRDKEAKDLDLKRKIGKTTNFLTGYGGGPLGLQNSLANASVFMPFEECEEIVENFFDNYSCLRRHISLYKDFILNNGVAVSIFGRVRVFQEVFGEDKRAISKALRSGYNHLIQSTASDMMLLCLAVIEHLMREAGLQSVLVSTVHDSLVIDALISELDQVHAICKSVLKNIPDVLKLVFGDDYDDSWIIVPLDADFEVGRNYLDCRRVTEPADWDKLLAADEKAA